MSERIRRSRSTNIFGTVEVRDSAGSKSEVSWMVELEVAAEAREQLVSLLKTALSEGISGLERDLQ